MESSTNGVSSSCNDNAAKTNNAATKHEFAMWNSLGPAVNRQANSTSFKSDDGVSLTSRSYSEQQLGVKVDMVYGLISMLDNHNRDEMTRTLLAMSHSSDSCDAMRQSGCISLLVQLIHSEEEECTPELRERASQALHNLIHCHQDDKMGRREVRVLRLLEKIQQYAAGLTETTLHSDQEEIGQIIAALMKLSFDEDHRAAMCQLGALHTLAKLIHVDTKSHGLTNKYCIVLRRYAGMTLTNLTFGHGTNKSTLCCLTDFMKALVLQLSTPSDHLRQVTASVLRNLSWRADPKSKQILREVGAVPALMKAAMEAGKESTLKSILSALWNFSAHCNNNKIEICQVEGALPFLIEKMKSCTAASLTIVENAGGVMRNISSHISVHENYREILRRHGALPLLLEQLRSPSLTIVSNACGTLWNLSAHCPQDQATLSELGAGPMLSCLIHSRHKMIAMGASAALKNLLAAQPVTTESSLFDNNTRGMPSLLMRKRRALEKELDANLAETCDNIDNAELASPLTPQSSTPVGALTSHQHLVTSTPNSSTLQDEHSSAHNTSDNNNSEDHNPTITRSHSPTSSSHSTPSGEVQDSTARYNNKASEETQNNSSHINPREGRKENEVFCNKAFENRTQNEQRDENKSQYTESKNKELGNFHINHSENPDKTPSDHGAPEENESHLNNSRRELTKPHYDGREETENLSHNNAQEENDSHYTNSRNEELEKSQHNSSQKEESEKSHYNSDHKEDSEKSYCSNSRLEESQKSLCNNSQTEELEKSHYSNCRQEESEKSHYSNSSQESEKSHYSNCRQEESEKSHFSHSPQESEKSHYLNSLDENASSLVDEEREQLSFSKMEEPYFHPHLDEDSNEPINLDQPTNYSLRYSERQKRLDARMNEDSRSESRSQAEFGEHHEEAASDCLQTFCTEDTPYNFSNSTSLSDLRITEADGGELSACKTPEDSKPGSGRSSQLKLSPDTGSGTPAVLGTRSGDCDETPLMFSRCSSLGSVSSCADLAADGVADPSGASGVAPEDRYSVVSEFSRITSGMISPSDLPDSPIHTAPVSPSPRRRGKFTFPSGGKQAQAHFRPSVFEDTVATYQHDDGEEKSRQGDAQDAEPLPPPPSAKDELKCYAVEESPLNLTAWSSLSDLTINTNTSVSATQPQPERGVFGGQRQSREARPEPFAERIVGGHGERIVGGHLGRDLCASGDLGTIGDRIVGERLIGGDIGVAGREDEKEDEDLNDEDILAACIQAGMESAKALTLKKKDEQASQSSSHQLDSSHEDGDPDDDDSVLAQCIQLGMSSSTKQVSNPGPSAGATCAPAQSSKPGVASTHSRRGSTQAGKPAPSHLAESNPGLPTVELKLDFSDEDILQQCILEGMSSYVGEARTDDCLAECIRAGMQKFKQELSRRQLQASSSSPQSTRPVSQSEDRKVQDHSGNTSGVADFDLDQWASDVQDKDSALLLEQCIEAGIPYRSKNSPAPPVIPKTGGDPTADDTQGKPDTGRDTSSGETTNRSTNGTRDSYRSNGTQQNTASIDMKLETKTIQQETNVNTTGGVDAGLSQSISKDSSSKLMVENKRLTSLKSSVSMETSMERSWLLTENLNDDLCEGLCTSGPTGDDSCDLLANPHRQQDNLGNALSIGTKTKQLERTKQRTGSRSSFEGVDHKQPHAVESGAPWRDLDSDEMKASLTHTWSDNSSASYATVSLSPPSCLKPKQTFVYSGERTGSLGTRGTPGQCGAEHAEMGAKTDSKNFSPVLDRAKGRRSGGDASDSVTSSPVRKSVAKVNPFPETAKHLGRTVAERMREDCKSAGDVMDELIRKHSGNATNHQESIVLHNAVDTLKCSPHILELECGKLGIISSLEFEDLNSVKPPSMMESITCMDRSIYNKALIGSMTSMHSSINLENVNPPSYYDEVSLLLEDSGLDASICNIDSIVSEVADDDEDITLVEDEIPLDPHLVSLEHREAYQQSPRLNRKVPLKQRRSLSKERYNTYTVQQGHSPSPPPVDRLTPKQRREQDRDRYSTRTIQDEDETLVNHDTFVVTDDTLTLMSGNNSEVEDLELDEEPSPPSKPNKMKVVSKLQAPRPVQKTPGIPVSGEGKPSPSSMLPLQRQGTFTKDEPSLIPVPSGSAGTTPKKSSGTKQSGSIPGIQLRNHSQPNIKRAGVRSSLSNTNLKGELKDSKFNASTPGNLNRRSYVDLSATKSDYGRMSQRGSRSNSNSSLNSSGSVTCVKLPAAGKKVGGPSTTVTSKIASLWKKVEDSKKGGGKKDTRVWISK